MNRANAFVCKSLIYTNQTRKRNVRINNIKINCFFERIKTNFINTSVAKAHPGEQLNHIN